jgi:hypothetical protein
MEKVNETPQVAAETPVYDPNKKYTWSPEDAFVLSGNEFGVLLNTLRAILGTAEAQRILLADRANSVIENAFGRAVELGVAKEVVEEEQNSSL